MKTIEFTEEEVNALVQLLDIAVKSAGLNVTQAVTLLMTKIGPHLKSPSEAARPSEAASPSVVTEPKFAEAEVESESSIELVTEEK